jgi:hypothetical protein
MCHGVTTMLLAIYLNDHLAGATVGRELARRAAASNRSSQYGEFLADLAVEIEEDRQSLLEIMRTLGVGVDRLKQAAGWGAEKLGRLKLNGRLLGYSPLSRVVELEALSLGVRGKLAMWLTLKQLEPDEPRLSAVALDDLVLRAEGQLTQLEIRRQQATAEAFS